MILTAEGHEVEEAESGEAALSSAHLDAADLILLDVNLPGIDGIETLKRIRRSGSGTIVVMISGQASVSLAVEATREGALDFLEKPLTKDRV